MLMLTSHCVGCQGSLMPDQDSQMHPEALGHTLVYLARTPEKPT